MDYKQRIIDAVDQAAAELITISEVIHSQPELAFKEHKAAEILTGFLRRHGFTVETGVAGLPTAFRATYGSQTDGPTVAFLAEYDALPEIGHGCGHNLIAMMSAGAALGLAAVHDGFRGRVVVLGTPGEEGLGGKINMVEVGVFNDIDCALMIHPANENLIDRTSSALQHWHVSFIGKSAHSSVPESGVNALSAVIQTFNNIDSLRALMPQSANINGIITQGGTAANIITEHASCEFTARAASLEELRLVNGYINRAVTAAGVLYGAEPATSLDPAYAEMHPNKAINRALKENMAALGVEMLSPEGSGKYGSSDIANVSLVCPTIHSYLDIAAASNAHSIGFTRESVSDTAHAVTIKGAKGLAMTGFDILTRPGLLDTIKKEFNEKVPKYDMSIFNAPKMK